jgi:hypothetical protein
MQLECSFYTFDGWQPQASPEKSGRAWGCLGANYSDYYTFIVLQTTIRGLEIMFWKFDILNLEFVSDFDIRISDFLERYSLCWLP